MSLLLTLLLLVTTLRQGRCCSNRCFVASVSVTVDVVASVVVTVAVAVVVLAVIVMSGCCMRCRLAVAADGVVWCTLCMALVSVGADLCSLLLSPKPISASSFP